MGSGNNFRNTLVQQITFKTSLPLHPQRFNAFTFPMQKIWRKYSRFLMLFISALTPTKRKYTSDK